MENVKVADNRKWILVCQVRERASKVHEACGDIETARIRAS